MQRFQQLGAGYGFTLNTSYLWTGFTNSTQGFGVNILPLLDTDGYWHTASVARLMCTLGEAIAQCLCTGSKGLCCSCVLATSFWCNICWLETWLLIKVLSSLWGVDDARILICDTYTVGYIVGYRGRKHAYLQAGLHQKPNPWETLSWRHKQPQPLRGVSSTFSDNRLSKSESSFSNMCTIILWRAGTIWIVCAPPQTHQPVYESAWYWLRFIKLLYITTVLYVLHPIYGQHTCCNILTGSWWLCKVRDFIQASTIYVTVSNTYGHNQHQQIRWQVGDVPQHVQVQPSSKTLVDRQIHKV